MVTLSANAVTKTSLSGVIVATPSETSSATSPPVPTLSLAYDTPVTLASFAGSAWTATLGAGTLSWGIDSTGKISGTPHYALHLHRAA